MRPCFRFRTCVKGLALTLISSELARGHGAVYEGEEEDEGRGVMYRRDVGGNECRCPCGGKTMNKSFVMEHLNIHRRLD